MSQLTPNNLKYIDALKKLKLKRQQTLQIELFELNTKREEKIQQIKKIECEITNNRIAKQNHTKNFYKNLGKTIVSERAFMDLEYNLAKYDLDYQDIIKSRDQEVKVLNGIDQEIEILNQEIKKLIISQEKYQYISEYSK